ncbi:GNAT family N-acetyltransferase [Actinophytocola xinjiangensis]
MLIRTGGVADVPVVMGLFDEAVAWLVARGNTEQWGAVPWSTEPRRVAMITEEVRQGELRLAEIDGDTAGALITGGEPPEGVDPVDEPELYVMLLLTSRRHAGRGIGADLLSHARSLAAERGIGLVRLDCFAGGDGSLIGYYERQGFTRAQEFTVRGWPGQVLEWRAAS